MMALRQSYSAMSLQPGCREDEHHSVHRLDETTLERIMSNDAALEVPLQGQCVCGADV